jgi:hypothetical protein
LWRKRWPRPPILAFFQPFLDEVVTRVKAAHPNISGGIGLHVESGGTRFQISAEFVYVPAGQRFEDLFVYFSVGSQNLATFELSRGSGVLLAPEFGQLILPGAPGDPFYDEALRKYAEAAMRSRGSTFPGSCRSRTTGRRFEAVTHSLRLSEQTTEATTQTVATASTTRTRLAA